jgi:hypothetical protein
MKWRSRRTWPPIIGTSSVKTAIIMAMGKYGGLTIDELCDTLQLPPPHVNKRLIELRSQRIVTSFRWGGNTHLKSGGPPPPRRLLQKLMWTIDPRHPLLRRLLRLGRLLEKTFPLPGPAPVKTRRQLIQLPRFPQLSLSNSELQVFGVAPMARVIMMLSRVSKMRVYSLRKILGLSKAAIDPQNLLISYGLLNIERPRGPRGPCLVSLNREFRAYSYIRSLARTIDKLTGEEYLALTKSRILMITGENLRRVNAQRAARRAQGKPYFLTPTGFAVTGCHNRWTPPRKKAHDS